MEGGICGRCSGARAGAIGAAVSGGDKAEMLGTHPAVHLPQPRGGWNFRGLHMAAYMLDDGIAVKPRSTARPSLGARVEGAKEGGMVGGGWREIMISHGMGRRRGSFGRAWFGRRRRLGWDRRTGYEGRGRRSKRRRRRGRRGRMVWWGNHARS
jgi:hypothetical protein